MEHKGVRETPTVLLAWERALFLCQRVYFQAVRFFSGALSTLVSKGTQCQNLS